MILSPLQICLDRHHEEAALRYRLDEELGTLHGMSWGDFVLLTELSLAEGGLSTPELAHRLSISPSRLLLQLMPLEKVGLVVRTAGHNGVRRISLRPNGQKQLREARETAAGLCNDLLAN